MLKVNIHNYEAYFLDYVEGNLSDLDRIEVEKFLALYPDKFDELKEFENITVPVEDSISFNKSVLKKGLSDIKTINDDNFEEFCIAKLEGDLDEKASEQYFNHLKQFPEKKRTEELYKKVYLIPDKSIKFPNKSKLKHFSSALFIRRLAFVGAAAASIGLLFTLQNPFNSQNNDQSTEVISQNVDTPKQEKQINTEDKEKVSQTRDIKNLDKVEPEKVILVSQQKNEIDKIENTQVEAPTQRQTILLQKASLSKPELKIGTVSANQLAFRNENNINNTEAGTNKAIENKKVVTLSELAFNEVKKVVPEGVQELAGKRPALREVAESGKKEINELLNKQVTIEKEIDEEGNIKSFSLNTSLFAFYTTKVKK